LLDRIADIVTTGGAETAPDISAHSLHRLEEGFDLAEAVTELKTVPKDRMDEAESVF
jgi:hypothetical protein